MSQEESNQNAQGRNSEGELPPELKAVEAELAALLPRDDRLDRERLIFLAGQASVSRRAARGAFAVTGWAWPASLAGMTAVAATLLVMLVARPEAPVAGQIPIGEVAVRRQTSDEDKPAGGGSGEPGSPPSVVSEPGRTTPVLASHRPGWLPYSQSGWFRTRAVHLAMVERMLAQGVDPSGRASTPPAEAVGEEAGPLPYREWLKTLLEDRARAELPSDRLDVPLKRGANS